MFSSVEFNHFELFTALNSLTCVWVQPSHFFFSCCYLIAGVLSVFWILFPDQIHDSNCFLSFFESPFHSVDSVLWCKCIFNFDGFQFIIYYTPSPELFFSPNETLCLVNTNSPFSLPPASGNPSLTLCMNLTALGTPYKLNSWTQHVFRVYSVVLIACVRIIFL